MLWCFQAVLRSIALSCASDQQPAVAPLPRIVLLLQLKQLASYAVKLTVQFGSSIPVETPGVEELFLAVCMLMPTCSRHCQFQFQLCTPVTPERGSSCCVTNNSMHELFILVVHVVYVVLTV